MSHKCIDPNEELFVCGWLIDAAVEKLNADPDNATAWWAIRWALAHLERLLVDRGDSLVKEIIEVNLQLKERGETEPKCEFTGETPCRESQHRPTRKD